jgi:hypothetical protein
MKKNIIITIILPFVLAACQKHVDHPSAGNISSVSASDMVAPATIVTFAPVAPFQTITIAARETIFSDSLSLTENEAMLEGLRLNINGKSLSFGNLALFMNGLKIPVTGSYQNNILTIILNKALLLKTGYYKMLIRSSVTCPRQIFTVRLQQKNIRITNHNYHEFNTFMYGLPLSYSIIAKP